MKTTALALVATFLVGGFLPACGEKHDVLGTRSAGGGPEAGSAGSGAGESGGASGVGGVGGGGGKGGSAGRAAGGTGQASGGNAPAGGSGGQGGGGQQGGAGGTAGSGANGANGGAGGAGMASGNASGSAGEGGASTGGTAGTSTAGAGGAPEACPTDCTPGTSAGCPTGQVSWSCGNEHDYQELIDAGCTDQGTALPRYCCPPTYHAQCGSCTEVLTLERCEARTDCHSVFTDIAGCECQPDGCCARFSSCADGTLANCEGPATCAAATPFCSDPVYVVSYTSGCFEGCVKPADCATQ